LKAIKEGQISEEQINVSVKRLFTIRFRLGMFDSESIVPFSKIGLSALESPPHQAHALKMAQQSLVLLKNERNLLPLNKNIKNIAVVGPNADDKAVLLSNYYGYPSQVTTILEAIKKKVKGKVSYEKGINLIDNNVFKSTPQPKLFTFEGKQGFQAEYFQNTKFEGKPLLIRIEKNIDHQWGDGEYVAEQIIANQVSIRWTATYTAEKSSEITFELKGDDRATLLVDGEKRIETDLKNGYYTFQAEKGKSYQLVINYVQSTDNAEVKFETGMMEKAAPEIIAQRVKDADAIIFVGGISAKLEGEAMPVSIEGFKGGDRTNIALPSVQTDLMKALKATGKPLVFINMSGGAMGFEWEAANVPAIIQGWYGGQSGGTAIADVLFGDYNPAGRLPVTFYKNVNDLPDFEDYRMENRTYRYFKGEPLYPFGFGLSYTTFQYSNLAISRKNTNEIFVKVKVTNAGKKQGDEVAQLYLSHRDAGFKTPIRTLKGFQRINLKAGQSKFISFKLTAKELMEVEANGELIKMKGNFDVSVGGEQPIKTTTSAGKFVQKSIEII
jgi:beta-glucosidase